MKRFMLFLLMFSIALHLFSWDWVKRAGGTQLDWPWSICTDNLNNCYLTGSFQGTSYFGADSLTSSNAVSDLFISKMNADGDFEWTIQGFSNVGAVGLSIDCFDDNLYVTGYYTDSLYIDGHSLSGIGSWDVFVLKCTLDGVVLDCINFGSELSDIGYGLSTNGSKVFVCGWYNENMLIANQIVDNSGGSDIYIAQFDMDLNYESITTGNGIGVNYAYEVDSDMNAFYAVGTSGGDLLFNNIEVDSTSCSYLYLKDLNSNNDSYNIMPGAGIMNVKTDNFGNVYLVGTFDGNAKFGDITLNSHNNSPDFFCAKFNNNHQWEWAKSYGSNYIDKGKDITVYNDKVYMVCNFNDTLFVENNQYISQGNENIALIEFDNSGNLLRVNPAGGDATTITSGICVSPSGVIYVTGWFGGTSHFGNNQVNSSNPFDFDVFIAKYTIETKNDEMINNVVQNELSIYPNPVKLSNSQSIKLDFKKPIRNNPEVTVFNIKGQKLDHQIISKNALNNVELNIKTSGIYFLKVKTGNDSFFKKILIMK